MIELGLIALKSVALAEASQQPVGRLARLAMTILPTARALARGASSSLALFGDPIAKVTA